MAHNLKVPAVSFTLSIACKLIYYLTELAILLLKFREYFHWRFYLFAWRWTSELCHRTFLSRCIVDIAPHKYFNNIAIVCVVALLLNQSLDHVIRKLYIIMCFKGSYVFTSLWFKDVETDLPSDWFIMAILGCRSLVLVVTIIIIELLKSICYSIANSWP